MTVEGAARSRVERCVRDRGDKDRQQQTPGRGCHLLHPPLRLPSPTQVNIYVEEDALPDAMTVDLICAIAQQFQDEGVFDVAELIEVSAFGDERRRRVSCSALLGRVLHRP